MHTYIYWIRALIFLAGVSMLTSCEPGQPLSTTPGCQLYVSTDPTGATLICDNRAAPHPTPTTLMELTQGDHLIIARKTGYAESRATVTVQSGERLTLELALEPIRGLVLIHSKPPGANVEINDAHYGKTPLLIPDLPLGQHRVKFSAPEHMPKIVEVSVTDRTPKLVDVNLLSDSALLMFTSEPTGAQVTINGTAVGQTPCEASRVPAGKHRIEIKRKGYITYHDEVTTQPGDERTLSVNLTARPGSLSVVSIPPKARLYLNNQYKSETPFMTNSIPAGKYVLRAELPGYAAQISTNAITAGEECVVEFQLIKNSGTLLLSTEPPSVTVYLDGKNKGVTQPHDNEPISKQMSLDKIPKGPHRVQLTKPGYYDLTINMNMVPNQTVIRHKKLMVRPVPFIPTVIIRTGSSAEHTFRGIIRETYKNGDIKLEIESGIFKTFKASEIKASEPIKTPQAE